MSKNHQPHSGGHTATLSHEAEYRIIKHDLLKVLILNLVYLIVIVALYWANQNSHLVDNTLGKLLKF